MRGVEPVRSGSVWLGVTGGVGQRAAGCSRCRLPDSPGVRWRKVGQHAPVRTRLSTTTTTTAAAALLLALTGCGGGQDDYDSPQDVVAALEAEDVTCAGYTQTEGAVGAVARGTCRMDGQVIVSIYATGGDAKKEPERKRDLLGGKVDVTMVVGGNWTASCDVRADCDRIADATGGALVHLPA